MGYRRKSGAACSHSYKLLGYSHFEFCSSTIQRFSQRLTSKTGRVKLSLDVRHLTGRAEDAFWKTSAQPQKHLRKTLAYVSNKYPDNDASVLPVPWARSMPGSVSMFGSLWDLPRCRQPSSPSDVAIWETAEESWIKYWKPNQRQARSGGKQRASADLIRSDNSRFEHLPGSHGWAEIPCVCVCVFICVRVDVGGVICPQWCPSLISNTTQAAYNNTQSMYF